MENEKKFLKPELVIVEFFNEDIILTSDGDIDGQDVDYPGGMYQSETLL